MEVLCNTFPRQLLTVQAVMLSRPDSGRVVIRDKHIDVPTDQVESNRTIEGRAAFEGLERRQPACVGEDCNVEPRNELEMGTEACRLKTILGWAQIIERRLCEKVVQPIGLLQ
jgi:hypothetical protein